MPSTSKMCIRDRDKYTPWAQNHQMVDGKYCMGAFTVEVYDDNYDLPKPDADGKIDWKKEQGYTTNYDVCLLYTAKKNTGHPALPYHGSGHAPNDGDGAGKRAGI